MRKKIISRGMSVIIIAILVIFILACNNENKAGHIENETIASINRSSSIADSLLSLYVRLEYEENNTYHDSIDIMVIANDTCSYNGRIFRCYNVGLDLEYRFQNIDLLYIDTIRHEIYIYDPLVDSMNLWENKKGI